MANENKGTQQKQPVPQPAKPEVKKPEPETPQKSKKERFMELAPARTRSVLKSLEVLGNCSNRSGYEFDEAQIDKIFGAIRRKVTETEELFKKTGKDKTQTFTL